MYRTAAPREPEEKPPNELAYDATDDGAGRAQGLSAVFRHFSVPLFAVLLASRLAGPIAGGVAFVLGAAYSVWSWRTRKNRGGAILRVDRGAVDVEVRGKHALSDRFRLGDLADVVLDVKTIERVTDGNSAIPAMRFVDSKVGPKVDTARIVLVGGTGREVRLTEEYLPHMHAVEWLGKIRTFLRKHGWVPEDEREEPASGA